MGSHYSLVLSELILKTWDTGLTVALGRQHVVVRTCFSTLLSWSLLLPAPALPEPKIHLSSPSPVHHVAGVFHQHPIQFQTLLKAQLSFHHCFSHHIPACCPVLQLLWFVLTPYLSKCEFSSSNWMSLPGLPPLSATLLQPLAPKLRLTLDLFAQLYHSINGVPVLQPVSLLSAQITFLSCSFLFHLLPMIIQILSFLTQTP